MPSLCSFSVPGLRWVSWEGCISELISWVFLAFKSFPWLPFSCTTKLGQLLCPLAYYISPSFRSCHFSSPWNKFTQRAKAISLNQFLIILSGAFRTLHYTVKSVASVHSVKHNYWKPNTNSGYYLLSSSKVTCQLGWGLSNKWSVFTLEKLTVNQVKQVHKQMFPLEEELCARRGQMEEKPIPVWMRWHPNVSALGVVIRPLPNTVMSCPSLTFSQWVMISPSNASRQPLLSVNVVLNSLT